MTHETRNKVVPNLNSKLTMDEEVVNDLLALFAKTTPINKTPPPEIINREDFSQSCHPSEERNTRWSLQFQMLFLGIRQDYPTVVKCNNSKHQTHDYLLGSTTFYLSLEWVFEEYNISRNAKRDSSSWTALRKLGFQWTELHEAST
jgi:hypothetical protein